MLPPETIYKFNVANLRSLTTALTQIKRTIHEAIAINNQSIISSYTRLFALTLGAWSEIRLRKLLYEKNGFSEEDREDVDEESNHFNRWNKAIEIAIRKHYNVPTGTLNQMSLPHSIFSKYRTLVDILEQDLRPVIEMRNKLAHGQWIFPFTENLRELSIPQKTAIENENILSLQFKHLMLTHLSQIIQDLIVSKATFERDFDNNYRKFIGTKENLEHRDFPKYCEQFRRSHAAGKTKRQLLAPSSKSWYKSWYSILKKFLFKK